jgi:hypothetical protein
MLKEVLLREATGMPFNLLFRDDIQFFSLCRIYVWFERFNLDTDIAFGQRRILDIVNVDHIGLTNQVLETDACQFWN